MIKEFEISTSQYQTILGLKPIFVVYNGDSKEKVSKLANLNSKEDINPEEDFLINFRSGNKILQIIGKIKLGHSPDDKGFPEDRRWYYKFIPEEIKMELLSIKQDSYELIKVGTRIILFKDDVELFSSTAMKSETIDDLKNILAVVPTLVKALGLGG